MPKGLPDRGLVVGEFGNIDENIYEEKHVQWRIYNIFSIIDGKEKDYKSPAFYFNNTSWCLQLRPRSAEKPGLLILNLEKTIPYSAFFADYELGLKKSDGNVEQFARGTLSFNKSSDINYFIKHSELRKRVSELAPSSELTITCTMKHGTPHSSSGLKESKFKKLIRHELLSENLKCLSADKKTCDTTLCVKDKKYNVHKVILIARSSVFAAMFQHDTKESQTGIINIPDCDPESFKEFLKYLYSGELEIPSFNCAVDLYEASDKYDVKELKAFCMAYLMGNLTTKDLCNVVIMADKYDEKELFSAAQNFFNKNLSAILVTSEWECLMKNNFRLGNKLMIGLSKVNIGK